jgi:hypothetical protein
MLVRADPSPEIATACTIPTFAVAKTQADGLPNSGHALDDFVVRFNESSAAEAPRLRCVDAIDV